MLSTIAVSGCTPKEAAVQLEAQGVAGATLWVCTGYGKGWPLEETTMIRLTLIDENDGFSLAAALARAFEQEAVYFEAHDAGWLVYRDGRAEIVTGCDFKA
jgi:hypothetical protein